MRKIAYLFLLLSASTVLLLQVGCAADQCGKAGLTCSEGKACSFEPESKTLVCLPTCVGNNDCPSEQKCHVADAKASTGVCKPACNADEDCDREGSMACDEGVCGAKSSTETCKEDADCKGGETCKDKKCESASIVGCKVVSDCKGGEECKGGKCVKIAAAAQCKIVSDCKGGQTCVSGKCVAIATGCTYNSDCGAGELCKAKVCTNQCDATVDQCTAGYACVAGICKVGCAKDADCKGGETCKDNKCQTTSTSCESTGCPTGQTCTNGTCTVNTGSCAITCTRSNQGYSISIVGFTAMTIRCESNFQEEGFTAAVSSGKTVCPDSSSGGQRAFFTIKNGSDYPHPPQGCKITGAVRKTQRPGYDPGNAGALQWMRCN